MSDHYLYNLPSALGAAIRCLSADIRPAVGSAYHQQQVDMVCLLLSQAAALIDGAAQDLRDENAELDALLKRVRSLHGDEELSEAKTKSGDQGGPDPITISHLAARNNRLKASLNELVDACFAKGLALSQVEADLVGFFRRSNTRRKPLMILKGM